MQTIRTTLVIDVEMEIDDEESSEETLRYLVEQDLEDLGFTVYSCSLS